MKRIDKIRELAAQGILDQEKCPNRDYWSWFVIKPEELPEGFGFQEDLKDFGEIRWYGDWVEKHPQQEE